MEDLAPMVYLKLKIVGTKEFQQDYVVIDECQDLSFIEIATLTQIAKNGNITLAGDLAQSIIPPFYIKDWNDVIKLIKGIGHKVVSYHQLNRCYRTTVEIINFANKIFKNRFPKDYKLPKAVLRHGDEIKRIEYSKEIKGLEEKEIKEFTEETLRTICLSKGWELLEIEVMPDHIHLFISAPPYESPTGIIKVLKGTSAIRIFKQRQLDADYFAEDQKV